MATTNGCTFNLRWNELPSLPVTVKPPPGGPERYQCTHSARHRADHVLDVNGATISIPKGRPGRRASSSSLADVAWVRFEPEDTKAIEAQPDGESRSDTIRILVREAIAARRQTRK